MTFPFTAITQFRTPPNEPTRKPRKMYGYTHEGIAQFVARELLAFSSGPGNGKIHVQITVEYDQPKLVCPPMRDTSDDEVC